MGNIGMVKSMLATDKAELESFNKVSTLCRKRERRRGCLRTSTAPAPSPPAVSLLPVQDGMAALHLAAMKGHAQVCHALLAAGARVDSYNDVSNSLLLCDEASPPPAPLPPQAPPAHSRGGVPKRYCHMLQPALYLALRMFSHYSVLLSLTPPAACHLLSSPLRCACRTEWARRLWQPCAGCSSTQPTYCWLQALTPIIR